MYLTLCCESKYKKTRNKQKKTTFVVTIVIFININ